ncbi:Uncharacterised protein [Vibrio cholerae]|uniref:Uncharacterized protein n=1 Tax=Vibrio cholerae TaxID=666 RepID=A0A655WHI4_VIBCL|nr:Uncharacterised protein [Vibrio cholerae]
MVAGRMQQLIDERGNKRRFTCARKPRHRKTDMGIETTMDKIAHFLTNTLHCSLQIRISHSLINSSLM